MCQIIYRDKGCPTIPHNVIENSHTFNRDGFGIMGFDGETGKPFLEKGMDVREGTQHIRLHEKKDSVFAIHYRLGTHGVKTIDNVHPFPVGNDFFLMHNGIFHVTGEIGETRSDTRIFADTMEKLGDEALRLPSFKRFINTILGGYNKLAIMDKVSGVIELFGEWHSLPGNDSRYAGKLFFSTKPHSLDYNPASRFRDYGKWTTKTATEDYNDKPFDYAPYAGLEKGLTSSVNIDSFFINGMEIRLDDLQNMDRSEIEELMMIDPAGMTDAMMVLLSGVTTDI